MVKKSGITVQLVDALTKEPFKEHTAPDGETYVEVEPDAEYFIRVHKQREEKIMCDFRVDGVDLGYVRNFSSTNNNNDCGIRSVRDRIRTHTALKFAKAYVKNSEGSKSDMPSLWTGQVQVKIYQAIFSHTEVQKDCASDFKKGDVGYVLGVSDKTKSKGVQSVKGTTTMSESVSKGKKSYKNGRLIETFKLNYCTAPGLIEAGILPKPPIWDYARIVNPFKRKSSEGEKVLSIKPKKLRQEMSQEGEDAVISVKEYDLYDFSNLTESDSED